MQGPKSNSEIDSHSSAAIMKQSLEANKVLSEKAKENMYNPQGRPVAYVGGNDFGFSAVVFEFPVEKGEVKD